MKANQIKRFLDNLIKVRGIKTKFQVRFPSREGEKSGGNRKFGMWLSVASKLPDFRKNVKGVLIFSDNDDKASDSLASLQENLKTATDFAIPTANMGIAKGKNGIAIGNLYGSRRCSG